MNRQSYWSLAVAAMVAIFAFTRQVEAEFVEVGLTADDVNSDLGLTNPYTALVSYTLTDPFAYDPNNPTSTSPNQNFAVMECYHGPLDPEDSVTNMFYKLKPPLSADTFVIDLWGRRDDPGAVERDDVFDVFLRSGGFGGSVVTSQTNLGILDNATGYLRVTFDAPPQFDTIEIAGYGGFLNGASFTIMEARAAAVNPIYCDTCGLVGDYNDDGIVDAADYTTWRDSNINGQQGYDDWKANFGATAGSGASLTSGHSLTVGVPEPMSLILLTTGGLIVAALRRSKSTAWEGS